MEHIQLVPEVVCDFCNLAPVAKVYDAAPIFFSFRFQTMAIQYCDTKWTACAVCAALIDQDRWDELTERAVRFWHDDAQRRGVHVGARELADIKVEMARLADASGRPINGPSKEISRAASTISITTS